MFDNHPQSQQEETPQGAPAEHSAGPLPKRAPPASDGLSGEEVIEILEKRARELARVPQEEGEGRTAQVVTFSLGDEIYSIEAIFVGEIHPLEEITPVPCTPDFVAGVINIRGRILSVVDIHRFLGLDGTSTSNQAQVITVKAADMEIGLLVSQVHAVRTLQLSELEPALPTTARIAAEHTRGVSPDMLVLLDLEALMRDPRMTVWEEVGT